MVRRLRPLEICCAVACLGLAVAGGAAQSLAQVTVPLPPAAAPSVPAPPAASEPLRAPAPPGRDTVVLQGLDKVTARISTFEVPIDREARFGTLSIVVRSCHKTPPTEPPESAAFIQISEVADHEPRSLFSGWMFASSPALSALEHPVYDIWVLECRNAANAAADSSG